MERLDDWFGEQVRASSGSNKQCGGAAAELEVLPQVICQVHPSDGFSEPDHCSLGPIQFTRIMMVVMGMGMGMIMVMVMFMFMFMVMVMVVMMVVVVISDAADSDIGGIERKKEGFVADDDGRRKERFKLERVDASEWPSAYGGLSEVRIW